MTATISSVETALADWRSGLTTWLSSRPGDSIAGYCANAGHCVVAEWLRAVCGLHSVVVNQNGVYVYDHPVHHVSSPAGFSSLIDHLDSLDRQGEPITASQALAALAELGVAA